MSNETLNSIYRTQPAARKLFDWILVDGVEDSRTTVEDLMRQCEVSRRQAITALRGLAEAGYGEFKVGRKGHPSRLEWGQDPRALAERVVHGELDEVAADELPHEAEDRAEPLDQHEQPTATRLDRDHREAAGSFIELFPSDAGSGVVEPPSGRPRRRAAAEALIEHVHVLRPQLRIVVKLPADLSAREAEVLGDWIKNLSFER